MSKKLKNYSDPEDIIKQYGADALRLYLVNSPVVRGDNLFFKDDGVKDVRNTVIGKWINSFRFLQAQADLYETTTGKKFVYNHDAPKSENVMDRWILARCQSLIEHVKVEMEGELYAGFCGFKYLPLTVFCLLKYLQRIASTLLAHALSSSLPK